MSDQQFPLETQRHSLAHIMAQTVQRYIDPTVQLGTGPNTKYGFYYDMLFSDGVEFGESNLKELTKSVRLVAKEPQTFVIYECPIGQGKEINALTNQTLKNELLEKFAAGGETKISYFLNVVPNATFDNLRNCKEGYADMYAGVTNYFREKGTISGEQSVVFLDLCAGPHVANTKEDIDPSGMKCEKIAGAYRQADANNVMMTRLYGTAFENKEALKAHEQLMEEARKRDHRTLGKQLGLFTFSDLVGPGYPMFLPKGNIIKTELESFIRAEKEKRNYQFVCIPHVAKAELYEKSGHLGKYDAMMPIMTDAQGDQYVMKAMNCPHHFEIFNAQPHSYKDLPLRIGENTTCYRNEKTGELHGLTRVKSLTQDDTHHFVRHDQIEDEIEMIIGLMEQVYTTFGFEDFKVEISVRDPNNKDGYFGGDELWEKAENILIEQTKQRGVPYTVEEGEAAFYGPKIDIRVKDSIGRDRQLTTVQLDFNQPENFDMSYTGQDGEKHRPAVLHVAILGSIERFMGVMIEHYAGAFPVWLAPTQVVVVPVADTFNEYGQSVVDALKEKGIRVDFDNAPDSLNKKIRNAEKMKIPYILVVGEKEQTDGSVSVREYRSKEQYVLSSTEFVEKISKEYQERSL